MAVIHPDDVTRMSTEKPVQVPARTMDTSAVNTEEREHEDLLDWSGPDDPENPYNWPKWKIYTAVGSLTFLVFVIPLASCESRFSLTTPISRIPLCGYCFNELSHSNHRPGRSAAHGRVS
jgi:hypothetical protein